jgi:hypothetical protein
MPQKEDFKDVTLFGLVAADMSTAKSSSRRKEIARQLAPLQTEPLRELNCRQQARRQQHDIRDPSFWAVGGKHFQNDMGTTGHIPYMVST